jgi:hypothetical protein
MMGLADIEQEACAPIVLETQLSGKHAQFHLRLAVRMLESWLIADRERIATFLRIQVAAVPNVPDELDHPKITLVNLARRSTSRAVREGMVPDDSGGIVGADYVAMMGTFINNYWRASAARASSPSLERACTRWQAI